jgi:hypothetical protein
MPKILSKEEATRIGKLGGRKAGPLSVVRKMELAQKKVMEKLIYKKTAPLIRAAMITALGQNFVYRIDEERDSKGKLLNRKHVLVEDPNEIARALDQMEEGGQDPDDKYYYITAKEPDARAVEMLLNRGYGKPKETIDLNADVKFSLKDLAAHRKEIKDEPIDIPSEVLPTAHITDVEATTPK